MIALWFVYVFMAGACYAVGIKELKSDKSLSEKYAWMNKIISFVCCLIWPILFFVFIIRKIYCRRSLPNPELSGPGKETEYGK